MWHGGRGVRQQCAAGIGGEPVEGRRNSPSVGGRLMSGCMHAVADQRVHRDGKIIAQPFMAGDLAVGKAECRRHGRDWRRYPWAMQLLDVRATHSGTVPTGSSLLLPSLQDSDSVTHGPAMNGWLLSRIPTGLGCMESSRVINAG